MDKEKIKRVRGRAMSFQFDLEDDDNMVEMVSRPNGMFIVTKKKILSLVSPDKLDPDIDHADVPWQQNIVLPLGASNYIVARALIQSRRMMGGIIPQNDQRFLDVTEISWEVMNSLISLSVIKDRLQNQIEQILQQVDRNYAEYTVGTSPKPLSIVEYYEIDFRSFCIEVKRCLYKIFELLIALTEIRPNGDAPSFLPKNAIPKCINAYGKNDPLVKLLEQDREWQELWIEIRNCVEHPKKDRQVVTQNFRLEADRSVTVPTWSFIHPKYAMDKPQNLITVFDNCINNLLKFYEEFLLHLIAKNCPDYMGLNVICIESERRDIDCPLRFDVSGYFIETTKLF
jgi:hypothetical protein